MTPPVLKKLKLLWKKMALLNQATKAYFMSADC
jgi:hypothetical protein